MAILVTGANGFLGRYVVRNLLDSGDENLVLLDNKPNLAAVAGTTDRVNVLSGDVSDLGLLTGVIQEYRVEAVIHLAYILGSESGSFLPMVRVNAVGTANVFEAARLAGVPRVVYLSSVWVYPPRWTLTGPALREDDPPAPESVYGACKLFNEHIASRYAEEWGVDSIGLRFVAVFGLGRAQRRGIDPDYLSAPELALTGNTVEMPPDDQMSDWMYAADAAEVCALACRSEVRGHRIFHVSGECRPAGEITTYLRTVLPEAKISVSENPHRLPSLLNTDRLRTELSFIPKYSVEDGILEYLNDLRKGREASR